MYGKNQCWINQSNSFLQVMQRINDRVRTCKVCHSTQLPELVLVAFEWWELQWEWKWPPLMFASCLEKYEVSSQISLHFLMGALWKKSGGLMVCPVRHRENGRAVTQWSFLAPRSVSLLTCHSCCLFRSEVFFCSHKVINSSKFPFLRPSWCHCSVFLSFLIHGIFKLEIIIQSFPHFFNMWELLAPLGVCIHWSVTAGERLCERIPLPANSWNNSTDECGIAQKLFPPEVQSIPPLSLLSPLGNVIFTIFHFT